MHREESTDRIPPRRKARRPKASSTRTLVGHLSDPVTSIRILPDGEPKMLDHFRLHDTPEDEPKRRVTIGRSMYCDIVVADPCVSSLHTFLFRKGDRVFLVDAGSKNRVLVNGVRVHRGSVELFSGSVITVGSVQLLACGRAGAEQQACIPARDVDTYLRSATELYGSQRKAARILRIARSTLARWLAWGRFATKRDD